MAPKPKAKVKATARAEAKVKVRPRAKLPTAPKAKAKPCARTEKKTWTVRRYLMRRKAVQRLNQLAAELSVARLPKKVKAGRKVEGLIFKLQSRCEDEVLRKRLSAAVQMWVDNGAQLIGELTDEHGNAIPDPSTEIDEAQDSVIGMHRFLKKGFKLKSRAFMLTYNSRTFIPETWKTFLKFIKRLAKRFGAAGWAACLERTLDPSQDSKDGDSVFHTHGYLYWTSGENIERNNTDDFLFSGVRPRVDHCFVTNPSKWKLAVRHGMWYVFVKKLGTLESASSSRTELLPRPLWLSSLWDEQKLSHEQFEFYSTKMRTGHATRKRDISEVLRSERQCAVAKHVQQGERELEHLNAVKPARTFAEVDRFVAQFGNPALFRRPILAIVGGTNLGKSMLASDVIRQVAPLVGVKGVLEVTVEDSGHLDLAEFDVREHAGVVLDGVGDAMMLKGNREALQGRPKICRGGKSATMMYAYDFTLFKRAIVATFDLSARNLSLLHTDHWLSNQQNVIVLRLTEPSWAGGAIHSLVSTPSSAEQMSTWCVGDLAKWLESCDLIGPATTFIANGVNGKDFMSFTSPAALQESLRITPFCSKKLIEVRDAFLQSTPT